MNRKLNRKDFLYIAIDIVLTLFIVFVVYRLWKRNFSVPITYNNDGLGALAMFKKATLGEKLTSFDFFQAPYGQKVYSQDFILSYFWVKFIMIFTTDIGIGLNVYWLLTYVFTAITAYYFLRKTGCGYIISMVGSIIYNFLPYHYFRIEHLWLVGCFTIPIIGCLVLDLLNNNSDNFNSKRDFVFYNVKIAFGGMLIGITGIYYAFFAIVVLGFTMLYALIGRKRIIYLEKYIYDVFMIALPIVIFIVLPSMFVNNNTIDSISVGRSISQINIYGLNNLLMLLPIPGHRIKALSDLTEYVYEQTNVYTEAYTVSLGLIMGIGLIVSVMYLFKEQCEEKWQVQIRQFGFLNIAIILFATVGGLDNLVGIFVTSMVRCYNRMSVIIALFSIATVSIVMEQVYSTVAIKKRWVKNLLCFLIATLAVLDQTSACFAEYETYDAGKREYILDYNSVCEQYKSDSSYFNQVYNLLDDEKMIYIEPIEPVITSENAEKQFSRLKLYLNNISSVNMSITDEKYRGWFSDLEKGSTKTFVKALSILGFSGILIDRNAFESEESFCTAKQEIEPYADDEIVKDDESLIFYSFKEWKKQYLSSFGESELNELRDAIREDIYINYECVDNDKIYNLDENRVLQKDSIQYGPYIELGEGEYHVVVLGENLLDSEVKITTDCGKNEVQVSSESINEDYIEYCFRLNKKVSDLEFTLTNHNKDVRIINYYYCESKELSTSLYDVISRHINLINNMELGGYIENIPFNLLKTSGNARLNNEGIWLEKEALQYGPYINLSEGTYEVMVEGSNLNDVVPSVTSECGNVEYALQEIYSDNGLLVYKFFVEEMAGQFEFKIKNLGDDTVHISSYLLKKESTNY